MTNDRLFETEDGSHSLFSREHGVSYHSKYGAIQETQHVFIDAAMVPKIPTTNPLHILDVGFGTGLNAYMTLLESITRDIAIHYTAVEAYPISSEESMQLNYPSLLEQPVTQFLQLHDCTWEQQHQLVPSFIFQKHLMRFEDIAFNNRFDIIYFDAFAPDAQPELWEAPLLQKMYDALRPEGILTTYCAKGIVKRTLKKIGFTVEALPGPPRKREMTRATKPGLIQQ